MVINKVFFGKNPRRDCFRLLRGKKAASGINDTSIFFGIASIFIFLAVVTPYIEIAATGTVNTLIVSSNNATNLLPLVLPAKDTNFLTAAFSWINMLFNIMTMFVWSFDLPTWLNIVFLPIRIILFVIGYRLIRHGGG